MDKATIAYLPTPIVGEKVTIRSLSVEDSRSRRRDPEQVHSPKLIHGIKHFPWDPARSHRLGSIIESAAPA
jgi:hypothetical protein